MNWSAAYSFGNTPRILLLHHLDEKVLMRSDQQELYLMITGLEMF